MIEVTNQLQQTIITTVSLLRLGVFKVFAVEVENRIQYTIITLATQLEFTE